MIYSAYLNMIWIPVVKLNTLDKIKVLVKLCNISPKIYVKCFLNDDA